MRASLLFLFSLLGGFPQSSKLLAQATGSDGFLVRVDFAPCTYTLSATTQSFASAGGTGQVDLTTQAGCAWTTFSSDPFVTITSATSGSGATTIQFSVSANSAIASRSATLSAGGQSLSIAQT